MLVWSALLLSLALTSRLERTSLEAPDGEEKTTGRLSVLYDPATGTTTKAAISSLAFTPSASARTKTKAAPKGTPKSLDNGKALNKAKPYRTIQDPFIDGWFHFRFGDVGETADTSFIAISKDEHFSITITDLYLGGDRFGLFLRKGGVETLFLETPHVDADVRAGRITDPVAAFKASEVWSSAEVLLPPGKYHIIIKALSSPFGGGTAAIKFAKMGAVTGASSKLVKRVTAANVCKGWGGFLVVRYQADMEQKDKVCQILGLLPVELDSADRQAIRAATRTAAHCLQREEYVWIHSYDDDDHKGALALCISQDNKTVVQECSSKETFSVMCQVAPRRDDWQ